MTEKMEQVVRVRTKSVADRLCVWLKPGGGVPENGAFEPRKAYIVDLESGDQIWFLLDHNPYADTDSERRLAVGAWRKNTPQETSYYITMGTNPELIGFLSDPECLESCVQAFLEFPEALEKKYGPAPKPEPEPVKEKPKEEPKKPEPKPDREHDGGKTVSGGQKDARQKPEQNRKPEPPPQPTPEKEMGIFEKLFCMILVVGFLPFKLLFDLVVWVCKKLFDLVIWIVELVCDHPKIALVFAVVVAAAFVGIMMNGL